MRIDVVPARALSDSLVVRWCELLQDDRTLVSPYFRPEYVQAVAAVREDVFVGVVESAGRVTAFFPFQKGHFGFGRPVGGPFSDYQALIGTLDDSITAGEFLQGCGLVAWDFDHLLAEQPLIRDFHRVATNSPVIEIPGGFDQCVANKKADGSKIVDQTRRRMRKASREIGPVRFETSAGTEVLRKVLEWKSAQYSRTGLVDVVA